MKKLLITGGNGFLGSHIKHALINLKGYAALIPTSKELDLLDSEQTASYLLLHRPEIVLHGAASCGGILFNKRSPADLIYKNSMMSLNIFNACKNSGVKKIYTLGSVCSYPVNCSTPFKEGDIWNGFPEITNSPYGIAKRHLMILGDAYRGQYNIGGAHLIPVNMFGEKDDFDLESSHVIPALIRKFVTAVQNNEDKVYCWGTGEATREFLYAGDCAEAIVKAINQRLDTDLPINLGTGKEISIKNLAYLIAELTNYNGKIVFTGEVSDGQPRRMLDVSRASALIGFEASTTLMAGLQKTINWYRENI